MCYLYDFMKCFVRNDEIKLWNQSVRRIFQEQEMTWYKAIHLDTELLPAGKKLMVNSDIYDTNTYTRP